MSLPRGKQLKRCAGRSSLTDNWINELPDDILIYVLSFLTMKEAGRTSVLSKRWKNICSWKYLTTLNFEGLKIINEVKVGTKSLEVEEPKYFSWIDHVVSLHKASTIDEFRVQFDIDLNNTSKNRIDNWLKFSIQKRVKRLEIDFLLYKGHNKPLRYTFPSLYCDSLTSLELGCVNITGEILESFLSSCLALEHLSVKHSESLVELKIDGPALNLKSLTIDRCYYIKKLEISAPNLVSICYVGTKINVQYKSTPKLAQVSIGYEYAEDMIHSFSDLSSYLSQIEVLAINPCCRLSSIRISNDVVFSRVRKLDLELMPHSDDNLLFFITLLKACPVLYHLKLQCWAGEQEYPGRKGLVKAEAFRHYHLKIVEIVGFAGYRLDTAIVDFLIESVVSLDRMIIDPRHIALIGSPWEFELTREVRRARMRAKRFRTIVEPAVKVEIL